jgi:hypothetical protein
MTEHDDVSMRDYIEGTAMSYLMPLLVPNGGLDAFRLHYGQYSRDTNQTSEMRGGVARTKKLGEKAVSSTA